MTSQAIRDPLADYLITPQNAALVLIDYQPSQFGTVRSMDPDLLRKNSQEWEGRRPGEVAGAGEPGCRRPSRHARAWVDVLRQEESASRKAVAGLECHVASFDCHGSLLVFDVVADDDLASPIAGCRLGRVDAGTRPRAATRATSSG